MTFAYTVQRGDTLHRIARRHAVNTTALLAANPHLTGSETVPGQVIRIPERPVNRYVIQLGDSFSYIARRFNMTPESLAAANPGTDPARLKIGQTIVLPVGEGRKAVDPTVPYGFEELAEDVGELSERCPGLSVATIGYSLMGRPLYALRLGCGPRELHVNAAMHANEWITAPLVMKFCEEYAEAAEAGRPFRGRDASSLWADTSLYVVPMVNPDGVELVLSGLSAQHPFWERIVEWNGGEFDFRRWKANIRGVDLNDQFPAHWEKERERRDVPGPGPRNYTGEAPLSEPEAIALAEFTRTRDFRLVMALHTQGQEIYWNYRDYEPPEAETLAERLGKVSGYRPVKLEGSDAGYKDWFIQEFRRPGFTIEAGIGVNPLPISQFADMYESVAEIILTGMEYTAGAGK